MLDEVGILPILSKIKPLILRSSWSKLTLWFEEHSSDKEKGAEIKVSIAWSEAGFLGNSK